jgi:alpha-1,6-mannosyltransferase
VPWTAAAGTIGEVRVMTAARPVRPILAAGGGALLLTASVILAINAAAAPSFLVPSGLRSFPHWLSGPFTGLGQRATWDGVGMLLVAMFAGWLAILAGARALPARFVVATIVAGHVVFLLAPPLFSADVLGYVGLGRLGALHHLDPYTFGTASAPDDPIRTFLRWHNAKSPYGPLFTGLAQLLAPLGIAASVWIFKAMTFAASLGTVALVWRLAERRGHDPRIAAAFVGLNPVVLAFEVGGGHNDGLVVFMTVLGIALVERRREALGGAALVTGTALKVTPGLLLPFAFVAARGHRGGLVAGAAAAAVGCAAIALAVFGSNAAGFLTTVQTAGSGVAAHSIPNQIALALGADSVSHAGRLAATAAFAVVFAIALWRAWRGADWITCAGWATLALLLGTAWLLPWYATWLMPLAALGDSRRLRIAAIVFLAYVTATRVSFLLA